MLTNTLLLYVTQEALAKARDRLTARKAEVPESLGHAQTPRPAAWQPPPQRNPAKPRQAVRH